MPSPSEQPAESKGITTITPLITVIIPALDESEVIGDCLKQFEGLAGVEVLVVDGGSQDATPRLVREANVGELLTSDLQGRSYQMNTGASHARGSILLFLHADCLLPQSWLSDVRAALSDNEVLGGRFRLGISEHTLSFRLIAFFSTLRSRLLGITYGDQAIFVRNRVFEDVGGFPPRLIFEDSELCDDLVRKGRFVLTDSVVISSSRRWRECGVLWTVLRMWFLRLLYCLSVSDERLNRLYRNVR